MKTTCPKEKPCVILSPISEVIFMDKKLHYPEYVGVNHVVYWDRLREALSGKYDSGGAIPAYVLAVETMVGNRPNGDALVANIVFNHQQVRTIIDVVVVEPFDRNEMPIPVFNLLQTSSDSTKLVAVNAHCIVHLTLTLLSNPSYPFKMHSPRLTQGKVQDISIPPS
jgi:hypothetical protein